MSDVQQVISRKLQESDAEDLLAFLPDVLSGCWTRSSLLASTWQQRVLVCDQTPDSVAGYAEFYFVTDECHLLNIAISPCNQRSGFGTRLLQFVLEEASEAGCTRCLLEVRASNAAAIAFYEKAGFVRAGSRKDYYPAQVEPLKSTAAREDALLYSLSLC